MSLWAVPCLPLSYIHRPPFEADIEDIGLRGCGTLWEWSLTMRQNGRQASFSQWSWTLVSFWVKGRASLSVAARNVCCIRCGVWWRQAPHKCSTTLPCCSGACSCAVSPCLRNILQRRTWRKLAKGYDENIDMFYITVIWNKNIKWNRYNKSYRINNPSEIPLCRWSWTVYLMAATDEGAARKKRQKIISAFCISQ